MEYDNFEIEVGLAKGRDFEVSIRSRAGEAREVMRFPYDKLALDSRLKDLQIALLRSGGKHRRITSPQEQAVQSFGLDLFNALIANEVRVRYDVSQELAAHGDRGLRLVLRIEEPELAALPWEFMYDSRRGEYVCLSRNTPIVRYSQSPQPIQPLWVKPPLHVLCMAVSPIDQDILDVEREKQRLAQAVSRLSGLVTLTWMEGNTWQDLQEAMQKGPWHVFHFIGHGGFNERNDEGLIALADETGRTFDLSATNLARLLDHRPLKLVLLNSCEGARGGGVDVFSSTASILVRSGIPAVLAMQYEITDTAAIEFSRSFYRAVAQGLPLEAAVVEARKAISIAVNNTVEWGTPVLYLRSSDGRLFNVSLQKEQVEALYEEARAAMAQEEWPSAIEKIRAVLEQDPSHEPAQEAARQAEEQQTIFRLYNEGLEHYNGGRFDEAEVNLEKVRSKYQDYKDVPSLLFKIEQHRNAERESENARKRAEAVAQRAEDERQRKQEQEVKRLREEDQRKRQAAEAARAATEKEQRRNEERQRQARERTSEEPARLRVEVPRAEGELGKTRWHTSKRAVLVTSVLAAIIVLAAVAWLWGSKGEPKTGQGSDKVSQTATLQPPLGMAYVAGGEFMMGRDEKDGGDEYERPAHKVRVAPFFIGINEVTNEEYAEFVRATNHLPPNTWKGRTYDPNQARKPVTGVTWDDAVAFTDWRSKRDGGHYRLPTEEEWEFAARGTENRLYPWGDKWESTKANADSASGGLADVGTYKGQSPYGAYDMVGNAWEWTASTMKAYEGGRIPNQLPGTIVIRGGNYKSSLTEATTTYRMGLLRKLDNSRYTTTGFRCVKDISGQN